MKGCLGVSALAIHELISHELDRVGDVVRKKAAGAEALELAGSSEGAPFREGSEADVDFQRGVDPPGDASLLCQLSPALRCEQAAVKGGFDDEGLRGDGIEQLLRDVAGDELFIQRNGQGGGAAEGGHVLPLAGADGLLDAADACCGQLL